MPEYFTPMDYPFKGLSTDAANKQGMGKPETRKHVIGHPGAYSAAEFRSAQRAENAIRKHKRRNRGQTQDGLANIVRTQERGRV